MGPNRVKESTSETEQAVETIEKSKVETKEEKREESKGGKLEVSIEKKADEHRLVPDSEERERQILPANLGVGPEAQQPEGEAIEVAGARLRQLREEPAVAEELRGEHGHRHFLALQGAEALSCGI